MARSGIRNDQLRRLYQRALAKGWTPRTDGKGHLELRGPRGARFTISTTAAGSVGRSFENTKASARRAGLDVTGL